MGKKNASKNLATVIVDQTVGNQPAGDTKAHATRFNDFRINHGLPGNMKIKHLKPLALVFVVFNDAPTKGVIITEVDPDEVAKLADGSMIGEVDVKGLDCNSGQELRFTQTQISALVQKPKGTRKVLLAAFEALL